MNKDNSSGVPAESQVSGVGQTASIGRSTSVSSGAAKVFREFKWGLLTLFLLMVVVVGLVYDGGAKKKAALAPKPSDAAMDIAIDGPAAPPAIPGGNDTLLGPVNNDPLNGGVHPGAVTEIGTPPTIPTAPTNPGIVPPSTHTLPPSTPNTGIAELTPTHNGARTSETNPTHETPRTPAATPPTADTAAKTYKVQSGDTLSSIAQTLKLGKGGMKALIAANKTTLPNPDRLKVGMTLNVPAAAPATTAVAPTTPPTTAPGAKVAMADTTPKLDGTTPATPTGSSDYTVQSGDTLERIARKVFNDGRRWQDIHSWNREQLPDPAHLRVGQVLKIKQGAKTSANKAKISEADVPSNDEKKEVVETPLIVPVKEVSAPEKKSDKKVASSEKHDEPKVETMSATSSAFAP